MDDQRVPPASPEIQSRRETRQASANDGDLSSASHAATFGSLKKVKMRERMMSNLFATIVLVSVIDRAATRLKLALQ
jgi:hypothetical protein